MTGCEPAAPPSWHAQILGLRPGGINSGANNPVMSPDGTKVAFSTWERLVPEDTNGWEDLYVHDLRSGQTELVTVNLAGGTGDAQFASSGEVFSQDGRKLAFYSSAQDLVPQPTGGSDNVFVRDLAAHTTTLVSANADGTAGGGGNSRFPTFSPDGTKVAFSSSAHDLGPATNNVYDDVYLRDLAAGTTSRLSVRNDGLQGSGMSDAPVSFTPDGTKVLFASDADLTGIPGSYTQIYLRDLTTGTNSMVSTSSAGEPAYQGVYHRFTLSPDGTKVAFETTADNLVPGDANGETDVFVHDLAAGTTSLVSGAASGTGSANRRSTGPVFSPDSAAVAFTSFATNLGPSDDNQLLDVYVRD